MLKRIGIVVISLLVHWSGKAQECPVLSQPIIGSTNVAVDASLTWNNVVGVTGYIVSVGTTPGGTDFINRRSVGNATSFTPLLGWPEDTQLYVTITLFFLNNIPEQVCNAGSFTTIDVTTPPPCTPVALPLDGATNVNAATNISWAYAPTATGYTIALGLTPGSGDLASGDVGNVLSFNPPSNLPENTEIFATVTPYNENGPAANCTFISFTTGVAATLPNCTNLTTPLNGEMNVPLNPTLAWNLVPEALGYRLTIGSTPNASDILDNAVITTNTVNVVNFEPNRTYFATIIPFNSAGDAVGCLQESFSTILGCGPFFDGTTGQLTFLNPDIDFPTEVGICLGQDSRSITSTDQADGFRWYRLGPNGSATLISSTAEVSFSSPGAYRYEAYNILIQEGAGIECPTSQDFTVTISEAPTIEQIIVTDNANGVRLEVRVQGSGDYEFALDDASGPYQDSPIFSGVAPGSYTVYARDKGGCGMDGETVVQDLTVEGFPKFFTPNGDGVNDYWQFIPPRGTNDRLVDTILIFDRYGTFLAQIDPDSPGWNGLFNGRPLPESNYWFRTTSREGKEIKGYFLLKR
jgi:gliding motility-associated-like protein